MSTRSLNKVMLIGNLTRDPELRYTAGGAAVVTFGLATNKAYKDSSGELKEITDFHNIVAWNKMAEICHKVLGKGMKVYVEGSLSTRSWQDDAGVTHYKTEIRVNDMMIMDNKGRLGVGSTGGASDNSSLAPTSTPTASADENATMDEVTLEDVVENKGDSDKKSPKKAKKSEDESGSNEDPLDDLPF